MAHILFDEEAHTYVVDGTPVPSVTTACRFLSVDLRSDRPWLAKLAAERGRRVHASCALLDYGEPVEDEPDITGYLTAYRRFLHDYRPNWEGIEYVVGSSALGLAGTVDRFGSLCDGTHCVLDIKTGAVLHDAPLRAQLTGYARLLEVAPRPFCAAELYALKLSKDGTYILRGVQRDAALLDACLYLEQAVRRKP